MHLVVKRRKDVKQGRTGPWVLSSNHAHGWTRYELIETIVRTIRLLWANSLIDIDNAKST